MCVCVCVVVSVYVVRCCACGKTLKTRGNREKCVWYGVCVVWCCEVRKYTKTRETLGTFTKHGLPFWHDMAIRGPEKGPKTDWDLPTIFAGGPNPNIQKRRFLTKVLIQRS